MIKTKDFVPGQMVYLTVPMWGRKSPYKVVAAVIIAIGQKYVSTYQRDIRYEQRFFQQSGNDDFLTAEKNPDIKMFLSKEAAEAAIRRRI